MTARRTETKSARGQTTLCRFRAALAERGLVQVLFAEVNCQLDAKGLMLKAGTLIDATLVEAAVARPPQSEGEVSTTDPEAGFTRRGQRSFFGIGSHRGGRRDGGPSRHTSRSTLALIWCATRS